jgi:hypothetical protein
MFRFICGINNWDLVTFLFEKYSSLAEPCIYMYDEQIIGLIKKGAARCQSKFQDFSKRPTYREKRG